MCLDATDSDSQIPDTMPYIYKNICIKNNKQPTAYRNYSPKKQKKNVLRSTILESPIEKNASEQGQ